MAAHCADLTPPARTPVHLGKLDSGFHGELCGRSGIGLATQDRRSRKYGKKLLRIMDRTRPELAGERAVEM